MAPEPLSLHVGRDCRAEPQCWTEVDVDHQAQQIRRCRQHVSGLERTDAVDQRVWGGHVADDQLDHRSGGIWINGIDHFAGDAVGKPPLSGPVDRHHGHAAIGKLDGRRTTEFAGGADDERHAASWESVIRHAMDPAFRVRRVGCSSGRRAVAAVRAKCPTIAW
jgi:hypothetical protein